LTAYALKRILTYVFEIEVTDEFRSWYEALPVEAQAPIYERVALLQQQGPALRRPVVGEITTSAFDPQMKELIVESGRHSFRILFMFNPLRTAILLLGGDKAGSWNRWYRTAIPEADRLYRVHLQELRDEGKL
jgi:hypothetical protein